VVEEWISDVLLESETCKIDTTKRMEILRKYGLDKRSLKVIVPYNEGLGIGFRNYY
jgi:hypothetical protein